MIGINNDRNVFNVYEANKIERLANANKSFQNINIRDSKGVVSSNHERTPEHKSRNNIGSNNFITSINGNKLI